MGADENKRPTQSDFDEMTAKVMAMVGSQPAPPPPETEIAFADVADAFGDGATAEAFDFHGLDHNGSIRTDQLSEWFKATATTGDV